MNLNEELKSIASDQSVKKHTQKNWATWVKELNKLGCKTWPHKEIVAILKTKFKLTPWWQQSIARGYQVKIGVRIPNQTIKGTYTTTVTTSLVVTPKKLYDYLTSLEGQMVWLQPMSAIIFKQGNQFECAGEVFGEIRIVKLNKSLRLTWNCEDWPRKTVVQVHIYPKEKGKSMLVINHIDLPTMKSKTQMHSRWRRAVDEVSKSFKN